MQVHGRVGRNIAWDRQQGFQVTNNQGFAASGTRYLSGSQTQAKVDRGRQMSRYKVADAVHQWTAHKATRSYNNYYAKAWSDGRLDKAEQRDLKGLRRDKNVARAQVQKDTMRRNYGRGLAHAARNGRITPREQSKLQEQRQALHGMRSTVDGLRSRDTALDRRDSAIRGSGLGMLEKFQSAEVQHRGHGKWF